MGVRIENFSRLNALKKKVIKDRFQFFYVPIVSPTILRDVEYERENGVKEG